MFLHVSYLWVHLKIRHGSALKLASKAHYMLGFGTLRAKRVPESFLTVIPNGLVRPPILTHYRLIWKGFDSRGNISLCQCGDYKFHGVISTLYPKSFSLACAEVTTPRKRSYYSYLKGRSPGVGLMHANASECVRRNKQTFTNPIHNLNRKMTPTLLNIIKRHHK